MMFGAPLAISSGCTRLGHQGEQLPLVPDQPGTNKDFRARPGAGSSLSAHRELLDLVEPGELDATVTGSPPPGRRMSGVRLPQISATGSIRS